MNILRVQEVAICYAWHEFLSQSILWQRSNTVWFSVCKVFNKNIYQKTRKIICFCRNCIFLFWLYYRMGQECILVKFGGMFLVGFPEDLTSVWHWPTVSELECLILETYVSLKEVGKKTEYIITKLVSLRVVVHWYWNLYFYNIFSAKFLSIFLSTI